MALIAYPSKTKKYFGKINGFNENDYGFLVRVFENNNNLLR
jgi:hypothetical protein